MAADTLVALIIFAGVLVCTPGPANMLLMAAGANFGLRPCVPLIAGVALGKLFIHTAFALGLWKVVEHEPLVLLGLKFAGAIYVLYLAWKILGMQIGKSKNTAAGFIWGLAVHPLNPKAWAMVAAAYGQFVSPESNWWVQAVIIACIFLFWQIVAHTFWCWSGARAADFAISAGKQKTLNAVLAILMLTATGWALVN